MSFHARRVALAVPILLAGPMVLRGETATEIQPIAVLTPGDIASGGGEGFGRSAAISGDWAAVGAPRDTTLLANHAGAVYMYRRVGPKWVEHQKLYGDRGSADANFGHAIAMDGDWLVVSAPDMPLGSITGGRGMGFIFERDSRGTLSDLSDDRWQISAILNPPPSHLCCRFGFSVNIDADYVVVGNAAEDGRAYLFRWDGAEWLPDATLMGSNSQSLDLFGSAVSVHGSSIVVGAQWDNAVGFHTGSAYVFERTDGAWLESAKLLPTDPSDQEFFGRAVSAAPGLVAVGSGSTVGATYIYRHHENVWTLVSRFHSPDVGPSSFGGHLATDGNRLLVGATTPIWAFLFQVDGDELSELIRLAGDDRSLSPPVAIDGRYAVVGQNIYAVGESLSLADYAELQNCLTNGDEALPPRCASLNLDLDGRIDLDDYALFAQTFRGP